MKGNFALVVTAIIANVIAVTYSASVPGPVTLVQQQQPGVILDPIENTRADEDSQDTSDEDSETPRLNESDDEIFSEPEVSSRTKRLVIVTTGFGHRRGGYYGSYGRPYHWGWHKGYGGYGGHY